jgi:hypothetical protein
MRAVRDHGRPLATTTAARQSDRIGVDDRFAANDARPSTGLVDTAIPGAARCGRSLQLLDGMLVLAPQTM